MPRLGLWLGVLAAVAAVASGLGARLGWWPFQTGFAILAGAAGAGLLAAATSIGGAVSAARAGRGLAAALFGLALGIATAAVPASEFYAARRVPPIHDIATDTATPPDFVALAAVRAASPNGTDYGGAAVAAAQRAAYPDIRPAQYSQPPETVFEMALATARAMGWDIAAAEAEDGRIEATATTLWFGFKDDIVIRIRPEATGTRLDIRSASRVGKSDIGANTRRIRAFLSHLERRLAG